MAKKKKPPTFWQRNWTRASLPRRIWTGVWIAFSLFMLSSCCIGVGCTISIFKEAANETGDPSKHEPWKVEEDERRVKEREGVQQGKPLPKEMGKDYQLNDGVIVTVWGDCDYRKPQRGVSEWHIFSGDRDKQSSFSPFFRIRNTGAKAVKIHTTSNSEDITLNTPSGDVEPKQELRFQIYPSKESWSVYVRVEAK